VKGGEIFSEGIHGLVALTYKKFNNMDTDDLKQKRFELAEREFHSMDEAEIIDLLLMYVYEKMDDEAVELLHNDIFAER